MPQTKEERKRDIRNRVAAKSRDFNLSVREISHRHSMDVVDPKRRDRCQYDLKEWLLSYTPEPFKWEFSSDHLKLLQMVQDTVLDSGCSVIAMPRGSGKTTILQRALVWAAVCGHRRFPVIGTSDNAAFTRVINGIKQILYSNNTLLEDYPEVIYPIRALERVALRATYQLWENKPTNMKWSSSAVQFPTTPVTDDRGNSGVIISGGGITGALRGMVETMPDGSAIRPDLLLIDDPQTRTSAKSQSQTTEREDIINGDLLGMAGGGRKMAAFCTCTVIYPGDLAERLLDNKRSVHWTPMRVPMFYKFPKNMKLWEDYDNIRRQELMEELPKGSSNKFYTDNREDLDVDCKHYWPERVDEDCISAIQTAMNIYFERSHIFASEYQNQPVVDGSDLEDLDPTTLAKKTSGYPRGEVPVMCDTVTVHIDVQQNILFWVAMAWNRDSFGGYVIDYGVWPETRRRYFSLKQVKAGLKKGYKGLDETGRIRAGIIDCIKHVSRDWKRGNQGTIPTSRILVDGGWQIEAVETAVQQSGVSNAMVCLGRGIKATHSPMAVWPKKPGETRGDHWVVRAIRKGRPVLQTDVNYWKTQVHQGLVLPNNHTQGISFFDASPSHHQMISEHLAAETAIKVKANGRTVAEWFLKNSSVDNHFFDNVVGCMAAASLQGIRKPYANDDPAPKRRRRKRVQKLRV